MSKTMTGILMILAALLIAAQPVSAGQYGDEQEIRGFSHEYRDLMFLVTRVDMHDSSGAKFGIKMTDQELIEESFGGTVIQEERLDRSMLAPMSASSGKMFGFIRYDYEPALIIVIAKDNWVYMFVAMGSDMSYEAGDEMALFMVKTINMSDGTFQKFSAPRNFYEIDPAYLEHYI